MLMECAKRDCHKPAVGGSNYCWDHQPRRSSSKRKGVKKMLKKAAPKKKR